MSCCSDDPNPQAFAGYAWEDLLLTITMDPVPVGGIAGWTFILNVFDKNGCLVYTTTAFTITNATTGVFTCQLASVVTGSSLGVGVFDYEIWRTNVGSFKNLTNGEITFKAPKRSPV